MKRKLQNSLIYSCGGFLVGVGIIGVFLPILQGFLFIALGLYVISLRSEKAKRLLDRILNKFPAIRTLGLNSSIFFKKVGHKMNIF